MNWKPTNYEGYEVSDTGLVRSCGKNKHDKILKPSINHKGYEVVYPSDSNKNGYKTSCQVHRLVAEAFIPNSDNKPQVNHIDANKRNNHVNNLEWCTNLENHEHKLENNLVPESHIPKRIGKFDDNGNLVETYESLYKAAVSLGLEGKRGYEISRCAKGLRKTFKGFVWKYV